MSEQGRLWPRRAPTDRLTTPWDASSQPGSWASSWPADAPLPRRLHPLLEALVDHGGLVLALFSMLLFLSQLHLSLLLAPLEPGSLALQLAFTPQRFWQVVGQWSDDGQALYRSHFVFDHLHALLYGAWGALLVGVTRIFGGLPPSARWRTAALLPAAALVDWLENGLQLRALALGPAGPDALVAMASLASLVKWLLVLAFAAWLAWQLWGQVQATVQQALEQRLPPWVLALVLAAAMHLGVQPWPAPDWALALPWPLVEALAAVLALAGLGVAWAGRHELRQHHPNPPPSGTRWAPSPDQALVTTGVFSLTRNPLCLGLALLLSAWALWLRQPACCLCVLLFVAYVQQFQIGPEEAQLAARFGPAFRLYSAEVPRWL